MEHEIEWHSLDNGIADVTVTRGRSSHRVRVQMATGDETGDDELSTRRLAIREFERLEQQNVPQDAGP